MPIFSFILQGGKSRCCNKNLRKKYIVFEGLGALIFMVGALYSLINISILALLLIFLIFVDERYKEIALWNNLSLLFGSCMRLHIDSNLMRLWLI
jgi:leader peptidase (prepilin peptidase)/N-methyltransferase